MSEVLYTQANTLGFRALDIGHYPAGEPFVKDHHVPTQVLLRPRTLETFFTALFWIDALVERGYAPPRLILPCVPGARQDRLQQDKGSDFLCTLKSVARELNARNFPSVAVFDPHSHVTSALIDRCRVVSSAEVFRTMQCTWDGIIAPDGGAEKRAEAVGTMFRLPVFHAWKVRDQATGKLTGFGCEPIPPTLRSLLLVDDICDGGGTFNGLSDYLDTTNFNATLDLFTTHGYYTQGVTELKKRFTRIITTDSVLVERGPFVEVRDASVTLLTGGFV